MTTIEVFTNEIDKNKVYAHYIFVNRMCVFAAYQNMYTHKPSTIRLMNTILWEGLFIDDFHVEGVTLVREFEKDGEVFSVKDLTKALIAAGDLSPLSYDNLPSLLTKITVRIWRMND